MHIKKIIFNFFFNKLSNVNSLFNKHKGEECYIIGCGNSIKYIDLKLFNDKPVIGINEIIFHVDFKELKNKYVVHSEPFFYYPFFQTYSWKSPLFPIFAPTAKFSNVPKLLVLSTAIDPVEVELYGNVNLVGGTSDAESVIATLLVS